MKKVSEIRTKRSDFGVIRSLEQIYNQTIVGRPKSELFGFRMLTVHSMDFNHSKTVQISDIFLLFEIWVFFRHNVCLKTKHANVWMSDKSNFRHLGEIHQL